MLVSVSLLCDGDCSGQRRRIYRVERSVDENDHFWAVDVVVVRRVMVMIVMISVGIVDCDDDDVVVWWMMMIMMLVVVTVTDDHFYYFVDYFVDCHVEDSVVMCDENC